MQVLCECKPENDLAGTFSAMLAMPWQQFCVDQHCLVAFATCQPNGQCWNNLRQAEDSFWNEMVMQYITVLLMSYTSIRALSLGVDVLADLLVCTSHKLEAGYTMIRYAHVHMSSNTPFGSGNKSPCSRCTPSASSFAHCMQAEVLAVSDQDSAPRATLSPEG